MTDEMSDETTPREEPQHAGHWSDAIASCATAVVFIVLGALFLAVVGSSQIVAIIHALQGGR